MLSNAVIGLKPDIRNDQLLDLATSVVNPSGRLHLVSLVQVGQDADERDRTSHVQEQVEETAERLRSAGYDVAVTVQVEMASGVGAALLRLAEEVDADLIVIGLSKRSRVGKALLGSDAQSVLLGAACPVLTARFGPA